MTSVNWASRQIVRRVWIWALPACPDVIGDRAFGEDGETITQLGSAFYEGLRAGGVVPVIKHLPGHGRAKVDSHHALPDVDTDLDTLAATDFVPFRALSRRFDGHDRAYYLFGA